MSKPKPPPGPPAVETIEEAVALLRRTPAALVLCCFIGGVPFWLFFLMFLTDMSRDAFAKERLALSSGILALLYLWKKCWESVFASGLHTLLAGETPAPWTFGRIVHLIIGQAKIQPWSLVLRPLAGLVLLSGWVGAFFQSATVLGDGRPPIDRSLAARAWDRARLWPGQNHRLLAILGLFLAIVWLNTRVLLAVLPYLLKTLFAFETMASRSPAAFFNSTFLLVTAALALLFVTPLWRAAYVVRCFHGAALHTGADLRAALHRLPAALAIALALFVTPTAHAEVEAPRPVEAHELDQSISHTLERREFAWRSPRANEKAEPKEDFLTRTFRAVGDSVSRWLKALSEWARKFNESQPKAEPQTGGHFEIPPMQWLVWVAGTAAAGLLGWAIWHARGRRPRTVHAQAAAETPDLASPDLVADQLPEDGWLTLARDLLARGELRLALRAAYLASLAFLGQQQLVSIARHKSNRDYHRELQRRARARTELLAAFAANLEAFEGAWYGNHPVTAGAYEAFTQNLEKIRAC